MVASKSLAKLKTHIEAQFGRKPSLWIAAVLVAGFLAFYLDAIQSRSVAEAHTPEDPETAETYIPAGFVLVPIEVANFESLDSILGKFGTVDLYSPGDEHHKKPIKIAERVRILRAPLNPNHFAVLVAENDSQQLVSYPGPFTVVVQPMDAAGGKRGTKFVNSPEYTSGKKANTEASRARSARPASRIEIEATGEADNNDP